MDNIGTWLQWGSHLKLPRLTPQSPPMSFFPSPTVIALIALNAMTVYLCAEQPRHDVSAINRHLQQKWDAIGIQPAATCSDREFVRRIYLDLAGRVPTIDEVNTFLGDKRDDKRAGLIDNLLSSEDYVQHFSDLFDTLLMGRTNEGKYNQRVSSGWRSYLEETFRKNRPWNEVAAEVLLARPQRRDQRGAVWFLYERNNKHQAIAEAVAPAFFGIRIECAQCHDHMIANEIEQAHYWGLVAFFNRSKNLKTKQGLQVAESAVGGFSDFANLEGDSTPNHLTFFGATTVEEPRPTDGEKQTEEDDLYVPRDKSDSPRVPKFSRREQFVEQVLRNHSLVPRAMVNRLWAIMLGRGIVHPYDEMDSVHAPSHPELLDWLSERFAESGYDIRELVRCLAQSRAYQLESRRPQKVHDPSTFAWYLERPLTAEQLARSIQQVAAGGFKNDAEMVKQFRQQITDVLPDEASVEIGDTLFFTNGKGLDTFLQDSLRQDGLLKQVSQLTKIEQQVVRLFQAVYSRPPSGEEKAAVAEYLQARTDRQDKALTQVLWALLTSAEFQFNH